jgi:hypothetical protein
MFVAWAIFPVLLVAVFLGIGLLIEQATGRSLPGALLAPLGMAGVTVIGLATSAFATTAPSTAPLVCLLAVVGFVAAVRRRRSFRPEPWPLALALAVFAVFAAPVVLSGEATFAGYIKLDDTATWFAITDRLMEHGRDISSLPPSSYEATLYFSLAGWYPVGAFIPLGVGAKLSGEDVAWVFQPYLALLASLTALSLWELTRRVRLAAALRAAAVFVAAQAALIFAYAMWGGIKELGTAALIGLIAALTPRALEDGERSVRALLPLALGAAALVGLVSFGAGPWLLGLFGAAALLLLCERGPNALWAAGWRFAVLLVPLVAVGLIGHPLFPESTKFLLSASTDLGNLAGPISPAHLLGIWPAHDFREEVSAPALAGALMTLVAMAALTGAWGALRDRDPGLLVALGGAALGCALIAIFGSAWVAAKSYAIASPFALLFAFLGLAFLSRLRAGAAAVIVAALLAAGVLWSNLLGYGGVNLGPRQQLGELETIGERFGGVEPALMAEYQPYGVRHFLRDMAPEGASELRRRAVTLSDGTTLEKGEQADIDRFSLATIFAYRTLVLRRAPSFSRPPAAYRLAWQGDYYDVWIRRPLARAPLDHLALGDEVDPGGVPTCPDVIRLGEEAATVGGRLVAAPARQVLAFAIGRARHTGGLARTRAGATYLEPQGSAGEFTLPLNLPASGSYEVWLGGSLRPEATLSVDGEEVGSLRQQLNTPGNYLDFGTAKLSRGRHVLSVALGGPDLHPGSAGTDGPLGPLVLDRPGKDPPLRSFPPARAKSLCRHRWDWIEAIRPR